MLLITENKQSIIFDEGEEVIPNTYRRILITDNIHSEKGSVFDRLGLKTNAKTYIEVVGLREECARQPYSQKRINSDVLGPRSTSNI